jgi:hypothetical protein
MTSRPVRGYRRTGTEIAVRHRRFDKATWSDFGVRPFHGIRCHLCKAVLATDDGTPRWDVVGRDVQFVCAGGCRG